MFKSEAESLNKSLKRAEEACKVLEGQLASQSAAFEKIKTDTKKALQNEAELRSHIEWQLKCATEVSLRKLLSPTAKALDIPMVILGGTQSQGKSGNTKGCFFRSSG